MTQRLFYGFLIFLILAIALYVLRGLGILTSIPGGIIYLLFVLAIALGIIWRILARRR